MTTTDPAAAAGPQAGPLPHCPPEEQGVPSSALLALLRRWEDGGLEPHGVTVLRHGHVLAEGSWTPYRRDGIALVYSVSKTFTACAVGLAADEGLLRLDERVVDLFPEAAHAAGSRASVLTLHDLLAMRTGHHTDTLDRRDAGFSGFPEHFLASEPEEAPGWFVYHNGATLMAALAVQRRSGLRLLDYLRPRLLRPLGIDDAAWAGRDGLDAGYSGLHVPTTALARLGELVRRDGVWQGRRLLPQGWVAAMTSAHTDTSGHPETADWRQGYGYQMWRCRHDAVRADGAYGQFSVVVPDAGLVVALTSCTERTQETLDAIWDILLPALSPDPLDRDENAHTALTAHLAALSLPRPSGSVSVPPGGPWSFRHDPTEDLPALARVDLAPRDDGWTLTVVEGEDRTVVPCGDGAWAEASEAPFVAAGGWTDGATFEAAVVAVETPHVLHLRCADGVVTGRWNGVPLNRPVLAELRAPRD